MQQVPLIPTVIPEFAAANIQDPEAASIALAIFALGPGSPREPRFGRDDRGIQVEGAPDVG
jgi:hypothetical protein